MNLMIEQRKSAKMQQDLELNIAMHAKIPFKRPLTCCTKSQINHFNQALLLLTKASTPAEPYCKLDK